MKQGAFPSISGSSRSTTRRAALPRHCTRRGLISAGLALAFFRAPSLDRHEMARGRATRIEERLVPADPVDRDALPEDRLHEPASAGPWYGRCASTNTVLTEWDEVRWSVRKMRVASYPPRSARRASEKLERPCPRPPTGRGGSLKAPVSCASKASTSPSIAMKAAPRRWLLRRKGRCSRWKSADAATRWRIRARCSSSAKIERSLVEGREIGPRQGAQAERTLKGARWCKVSRTGVECDARFRQAPHRPCRHGGRGGVLASAQGPRGSRGARIQTASREAGRSGRAAATALPP